GQKLVAVAQQEEGEALAAVGALLRQFTVLGLISAVGIVLTATLLARRFSRPLIEMAAVAERISQGEVHQELQLRSRDEIGMMADALRRMTEYLSEMATIAGRIAEGQLTGALQPRSAPHPTAQP